MKHKSIYVLEYNENKFMMLLPDVDKPLLDGMKIYGSGTERCTLNEKQYAYLKLRYHSSSEEDIITHFLKKNLLL